MYVTSWLLNEPLDSNLSSTKPEWLMALAVCFEFGAPIIYAVCKRDLTSSIV